MEVFNSNSLNTNTFTMVESVSYTQRLVTIKYQRHSNMKRSKTSFSGFRNTVLPFHHYYFSMSHRKRNVIKGTYLIWFSNWYESPLRLKKDKRKKNSVTTRQGVLTSPRQYQESGGPELDRKVESKGTRKLNPFTRTGIGEDPVLICNETTLSHLCENSIVSSLNRYSRTFTKVMSF